MTRKLIIDRFEGGYAVCEDREQRHFAIRAEELPQGAGEGCVLTVSEDGEVSLDLEETEARRRRIAEKQRRVFGE